MKGGRHKARTSGPEIKDHPFLLGRLKKRRKSLIFYRHSAKDCPLFTLKNVIDKNLQCLLLR